MTSSIDFCMCCLTKNSITGCSSHKSDNRGRLIDISSLNDLISYNNSYPTIVPIPAQKDILDFAIFQVPIIVGILIDGTTTNVTDNHFTEVSACPEYVLGLSTSASCLIRRNKHGIDFRGQLIDKPIFLLNNQTLVNRIRELSHIYNQQQISKGKYIDPQLVLCIIVIFFYCKRTMSFSIV